MKKTKKPFQKTIWILSVVAALTIAYVGYVYYSVLQFTNKAEKVKGVIIGFEKQRKSFQPQVQFDTKEGQRITFLANLASKDTMAVKTGSPVTVLYDPDKPQVATLSGFWEIWGPAIFLLIFGVGPLLFILMLRAILVPKSYHAS